MDDLRQELASLTAAFRARLEWARSCGLSAASAAPTPRGLWKGEAPALEEPVRAAPSVAASSVEPASSEADDEPRGAERLDQIRRTIGDCQRCGLGQTRKNLVFGVGAPDAQVMFVGEGPGQDEDEQGQPFVGAAGQLLTKMIAAMGLTREEVYIANIVKCRPPANRDPAPEEVDACEPFLRQQIEAVGPRIIIAMGTFAAKTLLRTETGITRLRGRFYTYQGIPLMPTYHPAFLLRNPDAKRPAWQDLKAVMAEMDRLGLRRQR
jgi:uracil-DNA glycosylase